METNPNVKSKLMMNEKAERPTKSTIKREATRAPASISKQAKKGKSVSKKGSNISSSTIGRNAARREVYTNSSNRSNDPDVEVTIVDSDSKSRTTSSDSLTSSDSDDLGYGGNLGLVDRSPSTTDDTGTTSTVDDSASSGGTGVLTPPEIKGTVPPLIGQIVNASPFNLIETAHAAFCVSPTIELFDLESMTVLADNPLVQDGLDASTAFQFNSAALGVITATPTRYMLRTTGCIENFERIITSFWEAQDLGPATTLLSKSIYAAITVPPADLDANNFKSTTEKLESLTSDADDLQQTYDNLTNSTEATAGFTEVFGVNPNVLAEAAPKITSHTIPTVLNEKATEVFTITSLHWNPTYTIAYEWYIDGVLQANTATMNYVPPANSLPSANMEVYIGMKNAGDSNVNRSKPHHYFTVTIPVANTFPAVAPTFALNAGSNNPTNTLSLSLDFDTGAFDGSVYANCETFSNFSITENAVTPLIADFDKPCSAGPTQTLPYTLQNTADGPILIKVHSRDQRGLVSAVPETITVILDRTNPVIAYTGMQANYRADRTTTFNWTLTEQNAGGAQTFTVQFFDGSTWSGLPAAAVTGGANAGTAYSTSFLLPNINTTSARLRLSYTDLAGNPVVQDSPVFGIQAPILGMTPAPHNYGGVLNKATTADTTFTISNTGVVAADNCTAPVLSGTNASEFSISTDNCGTNDLGGSSNCTVLVKANPDTKGAKTGLLSWTCGSDVISSNLSYTSLNNQPTSAGTESFTTAEDTPFSITISAGSDIDGDSLTYEIVTSTSNGTLSNCMASDADLVCDYSPNLNYNGSDSFIYRVFDGTAYSASNTTVSLTITPVNDAPTISPTTQTVGVTEDTVENFNLNPGADVDVGDTLNYIIVSGPAHGTLSCTGGTSTACSYTPDPDYNDNYSGSDSFIYKVNDSALDSNTATVTLVISNTNDAPTMVGGQSVTTNEDTLVNFTLNGAIDIDIPAQTLQYQIITPPSNGTVTNCITTGSWGTDITCDYTPSLNFNGSDSFTYRANDGVVDSSSTVTVSITVNAVNDAPTVTTPQSQSTNEDVVLNFSLAAGVDIESDPLTYSVVSSSSNGTISCTGTSCTYTPDLNYNGSDSFTYKANDGALDSNIATVNLTINPVNDAPVLTSSQTASTNEDTTLNFSVATATDVDGDAQTYSVVSATSNGSISCTGTSCTYVPNANFNGTDSFTYKSNDGAADSNIATVTITVNAINDAPTLTASQTASTNEDTTLNFSVAAASDIDGDAQTYSIVSSTSNGSISCTGTSCTYVPNLNYNGTDSFTYKSNDGTVDSNTATVTITVNAVNDAPTVATPQSHSTNEDTVLNFSLAAGVDIEGDTLTYSVVSTTSNGTLSCTGTSCTYTPDSNYFGSDVFTYRANDGALNSNIATVNLTVVSVNDAPTVATPQSQSTNEDTALNFNLATGVDIEGDTLTYSIVSSTGNGTISCTGTSCTYTPDLNYNGSDVFTYKANDGTDDSNVATVNLTINPINDAPTVASPQSQTTDEDTAKVFLLGAGSDVEGDTLTYIIVANPSNGGLSCVGGTSQSCTYTPNLNYNGSDSFTYKVNDGAADSTVATVNLTINPINDAPTLTATQSKTTNEDTTLNFTVAAASDVDGDSQTYTIVSTTSNGSLSCTGTSCSYSPNLNFNGSDSFTYKSNDGTVDSNTATVTITVNPVNDAPVLTATQSKTTNEDTALNFTVATATDVDGDSQTYSVVSTTPNGTLSCTGTSCSYSPNLNFNGSDSFTYRSNDGTANSNLSTVTITVNPVNDAPTVVATQSNSTNEDTVLNFNLGIGSDVENDTLTYIVVSGTSNGTLSCSGGTSRACTYTPSANYNGSDSFTYKVNDGALDSNVATFNLTINPVNDRPVMVGNQSLAVDDNTALNFTLSGATDIDLPAQTISYKVVSGPSNGTLSNCITTAGYSTDVTCTYTSNVNFHGTDSFTYIANDGVIDASSTRTVSITVTDKTSPAAPAVALGSSLYTNSTASTYTASSCTDRPFIFFNEGTQPAAGAAGWQACSTTANALSYTLSTGNGTKTVKAWSKDPNGNVSTASTNITVYYDTVAPTLAITTPGIQRGGGTHSVAWTMTEINSSTAQNFSVDFYNGTAWSNGVATKASLNGPLTTQAFNVNYTFPGGLNTTTARLRVNFTDLAGNSATITSNTFEVDSIAPAISISTPAASSYHQSSLVMTGNCETGADIQFSGAIQASFSITCSGGSFSQTLNLSDNDGNKAITLTHTDPAGNQSTTSRTFIRDEVAPILTKTTGDNPGFTGNDNFTWGGTCEGNYTINVTGDQTTSFACSSGSWTWTTGNKTTDGTFSYNLAQTDAAGNTSTALTLSWERDGTPPPFTMASPVAVASSGTGAFTSNLDTITMSGNCEGTNSIAISGAATSAVSCSSGSWTWTSPTFTTDATRNFTFTQSDSAGNTSTVAINWTRDTTGPALTLSENLLKTNTNIVTLGGGCENGLTINIAGAQTSTATCSSGAWSWTSTSFATDATRTFNVSQTNAVPNTTTVTATWIRETNVPTISAFSSSALNPTKNANVPVSLTATSQNANVNLSHVCTKTDDTTQPNPGDSCWVEVNGPAIALPLAQTLNINEEYYHLLGWTPNITLTAYAWVMDEAENISALTSAGAGTAGVDKFDRIYDPGQPPIVSDVIAANIVNTPNPPTRVQSEVPAGSDVYIRWIATDNTALPAGAVSLYYTTDEINFTQIGGAEALNHGVNLGCTGITLLPNEGCFKWTGGSPLNTSYKIRVKVTDATSISSQMISNPLNSGLIKIIAGNTEAGLGGSAVTAMFFTRKAGSESDPGTLVVTNDGKIYFNDYKRGILTVDPEDGKQKIFIPNTGTSSGDGGPAVNATLNYAVKMALDFQNRLLIMDRNRIRRVNLNEATPSIETIIGGGADTSDTVADPLQVNIYSHSTNSWTARGMVFFATPNGDIWFHSEYALKTNTVPTYRVRKYNAATGQVESRYFTGTGNGYDPTQDLSKCRMMNPGLRFDPGTSQITGVTAISMHHTSYAGCDDYDHRYSRTFFDPTTFAALPSQTDDTYRYYRYFHITGMDGNSYVIADRSYINRVNFDGTYTRVLGQGTRGTCPDGTANLSCKMDIQDMFVTSTGKIYFTDRGQIRTIDSNGNVVTLFGQNPGYGDGVNALNARFDKINSLARLDNGKIIVADPNSYYFKEFTIEGNIDIIAGDGNYAHQNTTTDPKAQGVYEGTWWSVDKATGDIYSRRRYYAYVARLNRATGFWEDVVGDNAGTPYQTADGQVGLAVRRNTNDDRILPIAFDTATKKLLTSNMTYNETDGHYQDFMLKVYDGNDSFRQSHLAGTADPLETYNGGNDSICALPAPAATCKTPHWDRWGMNAWWDAPNNRWIMVARYGGPEREVLSIVPGGNITVLANLPRNVDESAIWVKEGGTTNMVYYCVGGRIYKHNVDTDTDLGAMPWQISNLSCRGYKMDYNPTNNSIIFPFEQNGLYGVGEYFLP